MTKKIVTNLVGFRHFNFTCKINDRQSLAPALLAHRSEDIVVIPNGTDLTFLKGDRLSLLSITHHEILGTQQ